MRDAIHDLVIVGGGLVGACLARALARQPLRMAMVEARALDADPHDDRVIALARGSRRILEALDLWADLAPRAGAIHRIHVSERGCAGIARLERDDVAVDALGYVVEARRMAAMAAPALAAQDNLSLLCPARLQALERHEDRWTLTVQDGGTTRSLGARLLVAADGARSRVRELVGIGSREHDYGQVAVVTRVTSTRPHGNTAYERFTDDGPMALLPLNGPCEHALVLTVPAERAGAVQAKNEEAFLELLQRRFGDRLGRFTACTARQGWPLALVRSHEDVGHRLAVIGNAAHTLHPIAGQGFNLGLRDVAVLAELVADAADRGADPGSARLLDQYRRWRRGDQNGAVWFTDGLTRLFGAPLPPLRAARNLGLLAFDLLPPAKRWLIRRTMGLGGRLPRLTQGRPLCGPVR